ncbi:ribbon-helix-helix domain-containing protein [candidate division KSB1 bacterium]|nr:ribbon-helix-helix domain-containing protein [candidate division KSB1 bacterium]
MAIELTIKLEKNLVQRAKKFSKKTGVPISKLVADYFAKLDMDLSKEETELTPLVQSLKGSLRGSDVSVRDYQQYIEDKYL